MQHIEHLLRSLFVMASMVEARDPYTGGHLWRVSQLSWLLAEHAGVDRRQAARISIGGFLHDLGKIAIPDHILGKEGPLSDAEYEVIKTHPEVGKRLLSGHPLAQMVMAAVFSHHETPSGNGYPARLCGDAIPVEARIVGICDAFDAMTSNRPYRRGMPSSNALQIIEENLDKQFDRRLGAVFIELGRAGLLDHIVGHSEAGIPIQPCPMCGPTIVVTRRQQSGDKLYCRHCGGEAELSRGEGQIALHFTGRTGTPANLEPEIDLDLIGDLISSASQYLQAA